MSETVEFSVLCVAEIKESCNRLLQRLRAQSKITFLEENSLDLFVAEEGETLPKVRRNTSSWW